MDNDGLRIMAMAQECRALIEASDSADVHLPPALRRRHLLWMCRRIETQAENWPGTRLHRWIGFIQGGMLANGMLTWESAKSMFDAVKRAYGASGADEELLDHLDPAIDFELDLGGQG